MFPTEQEPKGKRRWRIAILLGIGVLINYFDRVNLSVAHDALHASFGISNITYGYLLSAYNLTYAVCQIPMGYLLDKLGVKRIAGVGSLLCGISSLATAVAPSVGALFSARFLLGIGESPIFPANSKAIGNWFPRHARSLPSSIFDSAAKLASALGVPIIGILLLHVGWRWSIAFTGLLTLLYYVAFVAIYREPEDDKHLTAEELAYIRATPTLTESSHEEGPQLPFFTLFAEPKVLGLSIASCAYNYTFYLLLTWLPTYLSQALGINLLHSFLYTGVPWLSATIVDIIVGGWMVDWLIHRGWNPNRVRMSVLVIGMAFGLGIFGAGFSHTTVSALFWITISISGLAAMAPVFWTVPTLIAPKGNVASIAGITNFAGQIGAISAPIVTGYVVTKTHSFAGAFIVAASLLLAGVFAYLVMLRSIEPMRVQRTA